jgi:hypothetical protein
MVREQLVGIDYAGPPEERTGVEQDEPSVHLELRIVVTATVVEVHGG